MICRKFFPPTEHDLSPKDREVETSESELLAKLPDPPSTEPLVEAQPEAKKQKVASELPEDDWEAIEKPEGSSSNGLDLEFDDDEKIMSAEEQAKADEIKEEREAALHVAEGGGDPPQNGLLRDW